MSSDISYTYDKAYLIESNRHFFNYEMRHTKNRYIGWFFVALAQFAIVAALKYHSFSLLIFSSFSLVYWYYLRWEIKKFFLKRGFDKSSLKDSIVDVTLKMDALHVNESAIALDNIYKVKEIDEGFLVYLKNSSLYFAKKNFSDKKRISTFRETLNVD